MKIKEELKNLRTKRIKDLYDELKKQYHKLQDLCFQAEFRKNKDLKSIKKTRQYIARIWTILNEKIDEESNTRSK